jgi:predicted ArsR family transcriptional regulator
VDWRVLTPSALAEFFAVMRFGGFWRVLAGFPVAAIDTRDREILEHLHQSDGVDVQSLCDLLGVTRTAIRQRIARLEACGLVLSDLQGQSRGRPRNVYRVTAEGLHALGQNYRQLAVVLWDLRTSVSVSGY